MKENSDEDVKSAQITLEDLMRINAHNRKMNLLLSGGLLFLAIGIILAGFERMLERTNETLHYMLYRYMVTGNYEAITVDYVRLLIPVLLAGVVGIALCLCYIVKTRRR